jgi:RNA polymerase sigma-70 factor (ECF subfamily)
VQREDVQADSELVAATLAGDRSAFGTLIDRHCRRAAALARGVLRDPAEAEDVTQEALLQAFLGLSRLREPARFGSWLCGIVLNLAKMRLRERRRTSSLASLDGGRVVPSALAAGARPEDVLEAWELHEVVRTAVERLPVRQREVVFGYYVEGLTCEEIAALLGEPAGTVRVRLHRARARLRQGLSHLPKEPKPMVEVTVHDVLVRVLTSEADGESPRLADERVRIVLLKERDGDRVLPIWIGPPEGDALALQLGGESMPRPMTADFMATLLDASGARIDGVTVSALREETFYATVSVRAGGGSTEVDARPSDALNLALRVGAPIYVDSSVMETGISIDDLGDEIAAREEKWGRRRADDESPSEWRSLSPELVKSLYEPPHRR